MIRKPYLVQFILFLCYLSGYAQQIDLSGTWRFAIDREKVGIAQQWYLRSLGYEVRLPGSMLTNGKDDPVNLRTPWVGVLSNQEFFKSDVYAGYRKEDNFKVPFWLQPDLTMQV